jgi:hypothetical protein
MTRLFTFGCSFTQYWRWPTWADAIGQEYDFFENWGICGGGNAQIFYNLMECHQRHRITPDDTVMIMWTNTSREDRYVKDKWIEGGNVYWSAGGMLPADYVIKFSCERGYLIRDLAVISATKQLLEKWHCRHRFFCMVPLIQTNHENNLGEDPQGQSDLSDVHVLYRDVFADIAPSVYEIVFGNNWFSGPGIPDSFDPSRRDFHPTPLEHLEYLDKVAPDISLSSDARAWMQGWHHAITSNTQSWTSPHRPKLRL